MWFPTVLNSYQDFEFNFPLTEHWKSQWGITADRVWLLPSMHLCCLFWGARHTPPWLSLEQLSSHIPIWASLAVLPPSHKVNHHISSLSYRVLFSWKNSCWSPHPMSGMLLMSLLPETWVVLWESHQIWILFVTDQVCNWVTSIAIASLQVGCESWHRLQSAPGELWTKNTPQDGWILVCICVVSPGRFLCRRRRNHKEVGSVLPSMLAWRDFPQACSAPSKTQLSAAPGKLWLWHVFFPLLLFSPKGASTRHMVP